MKSLLLTSIFSLLITVISFAQYDGIQSAVAEINATMKNAPTACSFEVADNGETKKQDEYGVIYDFNLNEVEVFQYEKQGNSHFVKFACASGNKCFHCDKNLGEGVIHFLEVSSEEDANKVIKAFKYLKQNIKFY